MTPPAFPSPRVVAGWLKHLAHSRPVHALAAGAVTFTRVEAAFREEVPAPPDPLADNVLRALAIRRTATAADLARLLHLGEPQVAAALREAVRAGRAEALTGQRFRPRPAADRPKRYEVGRRRLALRNGRLLSLPDPGPMLVPAPPGPTAAPRGWSWIRDRLALHGPDDLPATDLLSPDDPEVGWRAVSLERDEFMTLVLALDAGGSLAVYPVTTADAELPAAPALRLDGDAAREAFPEVFAQPTGAERAAAWTGWARSRAVPPDDLSAAAVALDGLRLRVEPPPRLADWLRANRADLFAGETWLWVGDGPVRRAAALDVH